MNFYSEFLAAVDVYNNYAQYFGQLTLDTPSMRQGVAPAATPVRAAAGTTATKPRTQTARTAASDKYKVRKGDTLTEIAQRFNVSVRQLMDTNNLRNSVIHAGQILLVR
jgi:LysM repeat protein